MASTGEILKKYPHMISLRTPNLNSVTGRVSLLLRTTVLVFPLALAACSSMDPGGWLDWIAGSEDEADPDQAVVVSGKGGTPLDGLVGDNSNSDYAPPVRRDVGETKPLVKRAPVDVTAAAAPAEKTVAVVSAPPAHVPVASAPSKPDIPDVVVGKSQGALLDHYHQRLRESAVTSVPSALAYGAKLGGASAADSQIHLNAPASPAHVVSASGEPGSSFQIATLRFVPGAAKLTPSDLEALRDVARIYKKTGGYVRVLGLGDGAAGASSDDRADVVAHELKRLGVPEAKIMVGAVALGTPPAADGAAARIYLDL